MATKKKDNRVKRGYTNYKTSEELAAAINKYFDDCDAKGKAYNEGGLCLALGISKDTLHNWYDGATMQDDSGFIALAQNAFLMIEDQICSDPIYREKGMQGRAVFLMKQKRLSGYVDKMEEKKDVTVAVKFGNGSDVSDFE